MDISDKLRVLIRQANAYDKPRHYINFDQIWQDPQTLRDCTELITHYLANLVEELIAKGTDRSKIVLLTPDSVGGALGILPIGFLAASKLDLKIAVWKEYADVRWGTSAIIGFKEHAASCILLQDVVDQGTTAIRVAQNINELAWKFPIYASAVLNSENDAMAVDQSLGKVSLILGEKPVFRYIISEKELETG